ncbi:STAS domain-containing protein [Carbonactinospora thermoautotrophica]|uniref:Anti-anti-sigma factor n=1 Tax=Carbonactinospora thermoautotrophica TaxID=1469144 RepID=A0A132MY49_9ACTN|nr:STAS domain-containing protein [Carbonactinospora thermoautotrophica]KWX02620.1 Anti-sigma-factor antagonist [Carbonactinospora thermoautotrophica]KWX03687.1 anti-anti-sigma factor [Carbonactinospora thermoautotrophica]KWX10128.1 anti-anti-sigma factor [Carbonactinospora thermoautotrophica]MCX9190461.1 STAS domain-containing protein [Carbonactinospora thermoautotrophica]
MSKPSSIPILRLGDVLLASVQQELDDSTALAFADELTQRIAETTARGVMLDISKLEVVDSFIARVLVEITAMARLLGARVVVAGMRPAVAMTLVELGLALPGVETALTVERALEKLAGDSPLRPNRPRDKGPGSAKH